VDMVRNKIMQFLMPVALFIGIFSALVATIDDYGIVWDEKCYIENARSIEHWFADVPVNGSRFNYESLNAHWNSQWRDDLNGNVHPPFIKLSAIAFRHLLGTTLFDNIVYQYRVSTAFWAALLVATIFLVIRRYTGSTLWGLLGGLSFITIPRFFAHAHFYATDMMISAIGFAALAVFMLASRSWVRILLGGALFGAALATKFTGILAIGIVFPMILIAPERGRFLREYTLLLIVSCAFFVLFNFPMLFNPQRELAMYFSSFLNREKIIPITTLYFGTNYDFRLPFHHPWVMLGITIPAVVAATALIGLVAAAFGFVRRRDPYSFFCLAPFLLLMAVYMLPSTPKHDGIRLFSSVWPFVILLSILGCRWLSFLSWRKINAGLLVCCAGLVLTVIELKQYHPHQLSYYNQFIGGAKGAQEKGFIISYWYEAFNRDFFRRVGQVTGDSDLGIYSYPNDKIVNWNQAYGLISSKLRPMLQDEEYTYILVLNRVLTPEMLAYLGRCKLLLKLETRDGAMIGGLYQNR